MKTLLTFYNPRVQRCIKHLAPGEPVTARQLSEATGIRTQNIYDTMEKVVKLGLARKIPSPTLPENYVSYSETRKSTWRKNNNMEPIKWVYMPSPDFVEAWAERQIAEVNKVKCEALKQL